MSFDFNTFGSEQEKKPGDINMKNLTPQTQKSGFNFSSFGSDEKTSTPPVGANIEAPAEEKSLGRRFLEGLISSEKAFGEDIGQAINVQLYSKQADNIQKKYMKSGDDMMKLAKNTVDPIKRKTYLNLAQQYYADAGNTLQDIVGELKTTKQVIGDAAGVALDVATAGTYGVVAKTAKTGQLLAPVLKSSVPTVISKLTSEGVKQAGKKMAVGAGIGYAYDVSGNMQNHAEGFNILTPGFGTLIGAGLPAFGYIAGAGKELIKGKPLETVVKKGMEKGVKPTIAGKKDLTQVENYYTRSRDAVKAIVNNKANLKLQNKYGEEVVGELPDTLDEFGDAVKQTKKVIFDEYDSMAQTVNKTGQVVKFDKIIPELEKAIADPTLQLRDPGTVKYAQDFIDRFKKIGQLTPNQSQDFITQMNADLQSFYKNPTYGSSSKVGIDAMIANNIRESLDNLIETATGKQYQKLKNMYGALKTIEKDVNHRALVEARKNSAGLIDFSNIFTYGDIAAGIAAGNPAQAAKGLIGKGVQMFYKWRNDPNTIVREMFSNAEKAIKKDNILAKKTTPVKNTTSFINRMFPQEGKEAPKEVMKTIIDKTKNIKPGLTIEDLSQEAKKYKTYNEFEKALNIKFKEDWFGPKNKNADKLKDIIKDVYFHGTTNIDKIKKEGFKNGQYFNSGTYIAHTPDMAIDYMNQNRGVGKNKGVFAIDSKNLKLKDIDADTFRSINKGYGEQENFVNSLKNKFDGIRDKVTGQTMVWNNNKIKNPQTLKDIFEKKGSAQIKTLVSGTTALGTGLIAKNLLSKTKKVEIKNPLYYNEDGTEKKQTIIDKPKEEIKQGEGTFYNQYDDNQTRKNTDGTGAFGRKVKSGSIAVNDLSLYNRAKKGEIIYIKFPSLKHIKTPYGDGVFRVDDSLGKRIENGSNFDFVKEDMTKELKKKGRFKLDYTIVR